jgi:hypothetical protein
MKSESVTHTGENSRVTQRGSITVVVLSWCVVTVIMLFGITQVGSELLHRQHLQHGADAIALAWVSGDKSDADQLARAYGAAVVRAEVEPGRVRVWVQRGDHLASATAQYTQ